MTTSELWKDAAYALLLVLSICLLAVFKKEWSQLIEAFFNLFRIPLELMHSKASDWLGQVKSWLLIQTADEMECSGDGPIYFIIGSVFYTVFTVIFCLCDFSMLLLTLEAMGVDNVTVSLPLDASTLTAATLLAAASFWGMILLDILGITRLAPWRRQLTPFWSRMFVSLAVLLISTSVIIGASMGVWRGGSLMETMSKDGVAALVERDAGIPPIGMGVATSNELYTGNDDGNIYGDRLPVPDGSGDWIIMLTMVGVAVLSLMSTVFSATGMVKLIKFLVLLLVCLISMIVLVFASFAWLSSLLIALVADFISAALNLLFSLGKLCLSIFGFQPGVALLEGFPRRENIGKEGQCDRIGFTATSESSESVLIDSVDPGNSPNEAGEKTFF